MPSVAPVAAPATPRPDAGGDAMLRTALATLAALAARDGAPIPATVVGPLPDGLTQLLAGTRNLALRLATPLPAGTAVTLAVAPSADGPAVVVRVMTPAQNVPADMPRPASAPPSQPQLPTYPSPAAPSPMPEARPTVATSPAPQAPLSQPDLPEPVMASPMPQVRPAPAPSEQPLVRPMVAAAATPPMPEPTPAGRPVPPAASPPAPQPAVTSEQMADPPAISLLRTASDAYQSHRLASPPPPPTQAPPESPRTSALPNVAPDLQLVDPQQAVIRQQSAAPLIVRLAALLARPDIPPQLREAAVRILATRVNLDAGVPNGEVLRAAVEAGGVLATPAGRDARNALVGLRAAILGLLGGQAAPHSAPARATIAPPLAGDPPQRGAPVVDVPVEGDRHDVARQLLSQADGALARLKLLQLASQPADQRPPPPAAAAEYRVEIPMLLRGETAMVQFVIEREARQKSNPRERGWRMRFALSFSATGEVGADVGLLGRTVNVALWADDPATAEGLAAAAADLAPALAQHGIALGALRVRRGRPPTREHASGSVLDSTR